MKLSEVPEFKAQAMAQEEIKNDENVLQELKEVKKELVHVRKLLTLLLNEKDNQ